MNDPSNGAEIKEFGGVKFTRLPWSAKVKIANKIVAERKRDITDNAKAAGFNGEQVYAGLNEVDSRKPWESDVIRYARSVEGSFEIVRQGLSASKNAGASDEDVNALKVPSLFIVAAWLIGLNVDSNATSGEVEKPANPTSDSAASASDSATQTSSA